MPACLLCMPPSIHTGPIAEKCQKQSPAEWDLELRMELELRSKYQPLKPKSSIRTDYYTSNT